MTISSSMNASVAGLSANASRLAAISDNISNSGTYGYKRAVTDFSAMVIDGGAGSFSAGGVRSTTSRLIDQSGALIATSNPTDLAVRGRGMLPVVPQSSVGANASNNLILTTTGSFRPDANGFLTTPSGLVLLGIPAGPNGEIPTFARDSAASLRPVQINANQFVGEATTQIDLSVNLPATGTRSGASGAPENLSVEYFDSLGASANLDMTFTPVVPADGASNTWRLDVRDSATDADADGLGDIVGSYTLTFDDTQQNGGNLASVVFADGTAPIGGAYDPATGMLTVAADSGPISIALGGGESGPGMTQLSDIFAPVAVSKDGTPAGTLAAVEVDANGMVRATYDSGATRVLYQIPLVDVPNVNGLESLDQQSFRVTPDSGALFLWTAGDGPTGDIIGYAREESATDVAGELTELIQTQRAYSSNAKVIQTVDEMLQETTNIKR